MTAWAYPINVMTCRYVRSSTCGAHLVVLCNFRLVQSRRQTLIKPTFHLSKLQKLCANWRTYGIGGSSCKLCHSKCFRSCIFVQGHLLLGVWSLNDEEAAMLLTCLTSNGNGRCLGEGRLLRNHHKLCAFLHLNMQHTAAKQSSGKWQTFFMSIALVSFFLWQGTIHISCRFEIQTLFCFGQISRCLHVAGGAIVWLGISDVSVNMFK